MDIQLRKDETPESIIGPVENIETSPPPIVSEEATIS